MPRTTRSTTVHHANGALETVFPANPDIPANPPRRTGARRQQQPAVAPVPAVAPAPAAPSVEQSGRTPRARRHQPDPTPNIDLPPVQPPPAPASTHTHTNIHDDPFTCDERHPVPPLFSAGQAPQTPVVPRQQARILTPDINRPFGSPRSGRHSVGQASAESAAGRKRRQGAKDIWPFYRTTDTKERQCIFCELESAINPDFELYAYQPSTSTGTLRRHLFTDHIDEWVSACDKAKPTIKITAKEAQAAVQKYRLRTGTEGTEDDSKGQPKVPTRPFSTDSFADAILEWMVADDQALNSIENPYLRALFMMLKKDLNDRDIPHRTHLRMRIKERWEKHLCALEKDLKNALGKVSFTSDIWSNPNLSPFMAVTGHWIESKTRNSTKGPQLVLELRSELLGFHRIPGRHDGEHLAETFLHVIDRLHITKIGWCTLDNASNNNTFMSFLEEKLIARGIYIFVSDENHIRCFPHIVNISSQAVLDAVTDLNLAADTADTYDPDAAERRDVIAAIRALIRAIRASSLRRDQFTNVQRNLRMNLLQLIQDVKTRWSSTALMIDRALKNRKPLEVFLTSNRDLNKYKLAAEEWDTLKAFQKILLVPHAFQQKLSAEKTPTLSDAIPSFQKMIDAWERYQLEMPAYFDVIEAGLSKLRDYQARISSVPAYKLAITYQVKELLIEHLEPFRLRSVPTPCRRGGTPARHRRTPARSRGDSPAPEDISDDDDWANAVLGLHSAPTNPRSRSLEAEIAAYELDTQQPTSIMSFWQENQLRYPTLFRLAMDILPIQGSSVPCERVFSSGKETMTARRNRISPDLMEALQMLKFSFKRGPGVLDFTQGTGRNAELEELEGYTEDHFSIPTDITSFVDSLRDHDSDNDSESDMGSLDD